MRTKTLRSLGIGFAVAATTALLSASGALAEDGHGDRDRVGDHDDHAVVTVGVATTVATRQDIDDEDVNEDRDEVEIAPTPPQPAQMEPEDLNEVNELDDAD